MSVVSVATVMLVRWQHFDGSGGNNTNGNGGGDNNVCCDGDVDGIDNDNGCAIVVTNSYDNHNNDSGVMMVKT